MPTSFSAQDMQIALTDLQQNVATLQASHASLQRLLAEAVGTLQGISHMLSKEYLLDDSILIAQMSSSDMRLDRLGRRFIAIFTPISVDGITAKFMGIAGYTFMLEPGWNILNFPDGTILNAPAGITQQVIIKATNWVQAGAI